MIAAGRLFPFAHFSEKSPVPGQGFHAAVVGGLRLRGEEAAGDALAVVPVMGYARAALSMPGTVIGAGTGAGAWVAAMAGTATVPTAKRALVPATMAFLEWVIGVSSSISQYF